MERNYACLSPHGHRPLLDSVLTAQNQSLGSVDSKDPGTRVEMRESRGRRRPWFRREASGNFLPLVDADLARGSCPFSCSSALQGPRRARLPASMRENESVCRCASDTTNTTSLSALLAARQHPLGPARLYSRPRADEAVKAIHEPCLQAEGCASLAQPQPRSTFGCGATTGRAAFAMRAAENYSSEPDLRLLQLPSGTRS